MDTDWQRHVYSAEIMQGGDDDEPGDIAENLLGLFDIGLKPREHSQPTAPAIADDQDANWLASGLDGDPFVSDVGGSDFGGLVGDVQGPYTVDPKNPLAPLEA